MPGRKRMHDVRGIRIVVNMRAEAVISDLVFPECPRWWSGALWFSDVHACQVWRAEPRTWAASPVVTGEHIVTGLGWLPDGSLVVNSPPMRRLFRLEDGALVEHVRLEPVVAWNCNDMVVSAGGDVYIGETGGAHGPGAAPARIVRVSADGDVRPVADGLRYPNGMALNSAGDELIVAESMGGRLTSFRVGEDGSLVDRRVFAAIEPAPGAAESCPDGICLDAEGAVWMADPAGGRVVRVVRGGRITATVRPPDGYRPYACVLAGADRRTLCIAAAAGIDPATLLAARSSMVCACEVDVPGAGRP